MVKHRRHDLPGELVAFENPHLPPPKYPRFTWWTAVYDRWSDNHRKYRRMGEENNYCIYPGR